MHLRSQVFVTESCCWLTGPFKIAKNAHNTRFLRLARLGSAGRGVVLGRRNMGVRRPGLSVRLFGTTRWLTAWFRARSEAGAAIRHARHYDEADRRPGAEELVVPLQVDATLQTARGLAGRPDVALWYRFNGVARQAVLSMPRLQKAL